MFSAGFNASAIREAGYGHKSRKNDVANYFFGRSTFNSSVVGWAGHTISNFLSNEDVAQILEMVRNHKSKTISIDNVLLRRANFPLNCYTLDLLDDLDMKREKI